MLKLIVLFLGVNVIYSDPYSGTSLDWRTKGAILPVPDKSDCGTHPGVVSALDAISALIKIKTGRLVQLSRQQIYDCSYGGTRWCPCGNAGNASDTYFKGLYSNSQYYTEESYPYTGLCELRHCFLVIREPNEKYHLDDYSKSISNATDGEFNFIEFLNKNPLAINVNADSKAFINYSGGILDDPECKGPANHVLLLVGFGTEKGVDYWIARNSWGIGWGEKGYIRIVRNKNMCGVGNGYVQPTAVTYGGIGL